MIFCASSLLRVMFDYAREKVSALVLLVARLRVMFLLCHPSWADLLQRGRVNMPITAATNAVGSFPWMGVSPGGPASSTATCACPRLRMRTHPRSQPRLGNRVSLPQRTSFQLIGLRLWLCLTSRWAALILPESAPPPLLAAPDPALGLWNLAM